MSYRLTLALMCFTGLHLAAYGQSISIGDTPSNEAPSVSFKDIPFPHGVRTVRDSIVHRAVPLMNHGGPEVQRYVSQIRIATMPFQRGERFPMIVALVADANQYDIPISSKINFLNYPKPDEGYVAIRYSRDSSRLLEPDSTVMSEHDYQSVRRLLKSAPWTERIWSLIQGRSLTVGDTIRIDSTEAQLLIREPDAKFRISSPLSLCLLGVRTDTLGNPLAELAISYTETLSIPLAESESLCSIQAFVETDTGRLKKMILWEEEEVYYTMINDRVRTFKMQSINVDWVELKQR